MNSWLADKVGRKKCVSVTCSCRRRFHLFTSRAAFLYRSCVSFSRCLRFRCANGSAPLTASQILSGWIWVIGCIIMAVAQDVRTLIAGRVVGGFAVSALLPPGLPLPD